MANSFGSNPILTTKESQFKKQAYLMNFQFKYRELLVQKMSLFYELSVQKA